MIISADQFLKECEESNKMELADHICQNFIETMKIYNPNMNWMSGSDWLSVMINDYNIEVTNDNISLIPK